MSSTHGWTWLLVAVCVLCAGTAYGQDTPLADAVAVVTADTFEMQDTGTSKNAQAKLGMGLVITSVTFSGIAMSYTTLCETAKICHEVNPVMTRVLGKGMTRAIVVKASVNAATHYMVWRYAPEGKWRTVILGMLATINGFDAIHDGRVVRRALRDRGRTP